MSWTDVAGAVISLDDLMARWDMDYLEIQTACNGGLVGGLTVPPFTLAEKHVRPSGQVQYRLILFGEFLPYPLELFPSLRSKIVFRTEDVTRIEQVNPNLLFSPPGESRDCDPALEGLPPENLVAIKIIKKLLVQLTDKQKARDVNSVVLALQGWDNRQIYRALSGKVGKGDTGKTTGSTWVKRGLEIIDDSGITDARAILANRMSWAHRGVRPKGPA